jgi:hypothetical protein
MQDGLSVVDKEDHWWVVDSLDVDPEDVFGGSGGNVWISLFLIHCNVDILYSRTILTWSVHKSESQQPLM